MTGFQFQPESITESIICTNCLNITLLEYEHYFFFIKTTDLIVSRERSTFNNIPPDCSQLSDPDNIRTHEQITQILNESRNQLQIESVWLPIVKINHTKWTWMDKTVQGIL